MSTTRLIIVDDIDPSIHYTGSWYPDQGSRDSEGNFGPSHQSTLHGVNSNASLSFAFNGSQVKVIGSNNILNSSGVLDPTWDCFIDGISIGPTAPFEFDENNWEFCKHTRLVDGPHVLTVNATVMKNTTFWFDNIQYLPSASVPLNQAAIIVDSLDSRLQYGTGWGALGGSANMTTVAGSIFTFDFIGVSLSWYGYIPVELPFSPSSATYSIDGEKPISFLLKGLPVNSTSTLYNQKFFETNKLSPTSHTLKVVYEGNNSTPLTLDYLIIQNGTSSSSTTTSLPTSTVSATSTPKKSLAVGSIVGGVIGGLALLVFAILGFFLLRRRQKRRHQKRDALEIVLSTPRPFEYTRLHTSNPSTVGFSYSPFPQTAQSRSHVMKGQATIHVLTPSVTNTEPPSTSSGVTAYPTNLHPDPFQQTALHLANPPSSSSSSPLTPSSGQPVPLLPRRAEMKAEALASIRPQGRRNPSVPVSVQSNDTWSSNANVVLHADSGIRMPSNTTSTSVVDVPPLYTPD